MAKTLILLAVDPGASGLILRVELSTLQPDTVETTAEPAPDAPPVPSIRPGLAKCKAPQTRTLRVVGGSK